ncbi:hypothetical protein LV779_26125 [Streptomyces thinghirensis]|nr:hypothetical protein [Streptomyces thinghirensis]
MSAGAEDADRMPGRLTALLIDACAQAIGASGGHAGGVYLRSRTPACCDWPSSPDCPGHAGPGGGCTPTALPGRRRLPAGRPGGASQRDGDDAPVPAVRGRPALPVRIPVRARPPARRARTGS